MHDRKFGVLSRRECSKQENCNKILPEALERIASILLLSPTPTLQYI